MRARATKYNSAKPVTPPPLKRINRRFSSSTHDTYRNLQRVVMCYCWEITVSSAISRRVPVRREHWQQFLLAGLLEDLATPPGAPRGPGDTAALQGTVTGVDQPSMLSAWTRGSGSLRPCPSDKRDVTVPLSSASLASNGMLELFRSEYARLSEGDT